MAEDSKDLTTKDQSLDVLGAGKLVKAIPEKAWLELVDTACTLFRDVLAPITQTTSGVGRLIQARFDRLVDAQKILAANLFAEAAKKAAAAASPTAADLQHSQTRNNDQSVAQDESEKQPPKASLLVSALELSSVETNETLREMWSNLVARELLTGAVHPEFPPLLARLTPDEACQFANFALKVYRERSGRDSDPTHASAERDNIIRALEAVRIVAPTEFAMQHLRMLHLIENVNDIVEGTITRLTWLGEEFVVAICNTPPPLNEPFVVGPARQTSSSILLKRRHVYILEVKCRYCEHNWTARSRKNAKMPLVAGEFDQDPDEPAKLLIKCASCGHEGTASRPERPGSPEK